MGENELIHFRPKDMPPFLFLVTTSFVNFELDDRTIKLLSTRFSKSKQTWFHSLKNLPNGVVVFNTKAKEVIFENEKLDELLSIRDMRDKYQTLLKTYGQQDEVLEQQAASI